MKYTNFILEKNIGILIRNNFQSDTIYFEGNFLFSKMIFLINFILLFFFLISKSNY
jgi:hypothetical protein